MTTLNRLAITVAATLIWGASATHAQIPSGTYSNTFSGTAALYDPTGDHTQAIGGIRVEFTLNMDEKGKLTGDGTAFFTNGTTNDVSGTADVSCIGAMKSFKGVPRASFTMKLKGAGGNGVIKETLDPDPANQQMTGTASGTVSAGGGGKSPKQKLASTPVNLNLPIGADGSWTLEINVASGGNKYSGSGTAAICGCKVYELTVSGNISRQGTSKLILKGQAISLALTGSATQDGALQVQTMKGKMLGQTPHIP